MPGLLIATSLAAEVPPSAGCAALAQAAARPLLSAAECTWLEHVREDGVCIAECAPAARALSGQAWSGAAVTVVMSGYLAGVSGRVEAGHDAESVAQAYITRGAAGVEQLDGSFVIVLLDRLRRTVMLWTDRVGSRPCFRVAVDGAFVAAPELKCLGGLPGLHRELVPGSLAAMAMNGALMDEHTYYRDVHLVGPARRITVSPDGIRIERYWQRSFEHATEPRPPDAEQMADCICRAVQRHVSRFSRPILALSGGLDSRIVLAACQRCGLQPAAITWGCDHLDEPGSDFQVGRAAGRLAGIEPGMRPMELEHLPRYAERVVWLTDGLTGHLGNFPEGDTVARELGHEHDALIRGDEMFGWAAAVGSRTMALRRVGVNVGKRLRLLRFLLRREVADAVLGDYRAQQQALLESLDAGLGADDVKDVLYWRTRFPRLIASQAAVFRPHLEVACPLLDAEVIDLVGRLNAAQRQHKRHVAQCARQAFPTQFGLPLNTVHSRADWRRRLRELGPAQRYLVETLLEPLAAFDEWFDRAALRGWLGAATAEGRRAPWPAGSAWPRRAAAGVTAALLRPTFKERVLLNLTTLKLWLATCSQSSASQFRRL